MAALACGVHVNITVRRLGSRNLTEDLKFECQEVAELIVSTIAALSCAVEAPKTSILKVLWCVRCFIVDQCLNRHC